MEWQAKGGKKDPCSSVAGESSTPFGEFTSMSKDKMHREFLVARCSGAGDDAAGDGGVDVALRCPSLLPSYLGACFLSRPLLQIVPQSLCIAIFSLAPN
jgi:hypothetical protein